MRIFYGLLVGLLGLGCGSDPAGGGGAAGSGGTGGAGGEDGCEVTADPSVTDISGRWAYLEVGSQLVQAPGFADPFHNRIISVLLLDQTQSGEDVTVSGEYCDHYTEDPDSVVHAVIPDAYKDSLKPISRTGTFAESGGSLRYMLPVFYEVAGATLTDVATEDLPVDPTDPRVLDEDGDAKPGVTIRLTGLVDGEVYVVERKSTAADGVAVATDRIEGLLDFTSEQSVLASDPASLKDSADATQTSTDPALCSSYFRMARVPDTADCAYVNAEKDTLFP
jgi:hypothetical protein